MSEAATAQTVNLHNIKQTLADVAQPLVDAHHPQRIPDIGALEAQSAKFASTLLHQSGVDMTAPPEQRIGDFLNFLTRLPDDREAQDVLRRSLTGQRQPLEPIGATRYYIPPLSTYMFEPIPPGPKNSQNLSNRAHDQYPVTATPQRKTPVYQIA